MANTEMKAPDLLRSAAALVGRALKQLDTSRKACNGCGRPHFNNPDQARVYERIQPVARRLREYANKLEGNSPDRNLDVDAWETHEADTNG
jgi:hypothetical protein